MTIQIEASVPTRPDWLTWFNNGERYYRAACPEGKKSRFTADLQYNLLSMSLEGYVMAIAGYHGCLPYNHTYTDLMEGLERCIPLAPELKRRILKLESIQDICSIEDYYRGVPSETVLGELRDVVCLIGELARKHCCL